MWRLSPNPKYLTDGLSAPHSNTANLTHVAGQPQREWHYVDMAAKPSQERAEIKMKGETEMPS